MINAVAGDTSSDAPASGARSLLGSGYPRGKKRRPRRNRDCDLDQPATKYVVWRSGVRQALPSARHEACLTG